MTKLLDIRKQFHNFQTFILRPEINNWKWSEATAEVGFCICIIEIEK